MTDIEYSQELERYAAPTPSLFGTTDPEDVVAKASKVAGALAAVIENKHLFTNMRGRKHVNVEGWTLLGSMLGVFPTVEWSRPIYADPLGDDTSIIGWEARVSVKNMNGVEIGSAEAMCTRTEKTWTQRDDYAIRSMAQTRAVSKAMRHPLGFVMTLAGYDPTPDAEMPKEPAASTPAPAEPIQAASDNAIQILDATIKRAEFFDPDRWSEANVLSTASRVFGREVSELKQLSEAEVRRIMEGAHEAIAKGEAEYAAQEAAQQPDGFTPEEGQ